MKQILLVEDEYKLSQHIQSELAQHGYHCDVAYDGIVARKLFFATNYDLIIMDINLPGINGMELCKEFSSVNKSMPIIILTAIGDIDTKIESYSFGAQDYLVKPVHLKELLIKVNLFTKEKSNYIRSEIKVGDVLIDQDQKKVFRSGNEINLTPKEFDILCYMALSPKRVVSKNELASHVWTDNYIVSINTIEVYVSFLRNKLDKGFDKKVILTKHGFGYYLNPEVCS